MSVMLESTTVLPTFAGQAQAVRKIHGLLNELISHDSHFALSKGVARYLKPDTVVHSVGIAACSHHLNFFLYLCTLKRTFRLL